MPGGGVKGQFTMNKWIPPDFNPAKLPKPDFDKYKQYDVRMMLPFTFKCDHCGNYHYIGTKLNMRKEKCLNEKYADEIKIFRFYMKCLYCDREILMKTDPKNYDYVLEYGGTRLYQAWKDARNLELEMVRLRQIDDMDAIKALENKAADVKREQLQLEDLDDITYLTRQNAKISHEDLMDLLNKEKQDSLKYKEATGTLSKEEAEGIQQKREETGHFDKEDEEYIKSKLPVMKKIKSDSGDKSTKEGTVDGDIIEEIEIQLDEESQKDLTEKSVSVYSIPSKTINEENESIDELRKEIYQKEIAIKKNFQQNNIMTFKKKGNLQTEYKKPISYPKKVSCLENNQENVKKTNLKSNMLVDYSDEENSNEE